MGFFRSFLGRSKKPRSRRFALSRSRRPLHRFPLRLEQLEDRTLLATISWDGGAGTLNWNDAVNWSGDVLPGSADNAVIGDAFQDQTITYSSGISRINSLTSAAALSISGGTFTLSGTSQIDRELTLSGGTLDGAGDLTVSGALTWTTGTLRGSGKTVAEGGLTISGTNSKEFYERTLENTADGSWSGGLIYTGDGATFHILAGATFELRSNDQFYYSTGALPSFVNDGILRKSAGTGISEFSTAFTNAGTLEVQIGTVNLSRTLTNLIGSALTGGRYQVQGTLKVAGADIRTNSAAIVLDGAGSQFVDQNNSNALANLATNTTGASLTLMNGRGLTTASPFTNAGNLTTGAGSTLTVTGDFEQTAIGTLTTEITDPASGVGVGQVVASGLFFLDGTLNVLVEDGFVPADGQAFRIMSGASRSGSFFITDGLDLGNGVLLELNLDPADVTLIARFFPGDQPPIAEDDAATTDEDAPVTISVLINDSDPDGDSLAIRSFTQPTHGSVVRNPEGTFTYTPTANFNGSDSFTYKIRDGRGDSATATVTVTVQPVNDPPTAGDDQANTLAATPVRIGVLVNDSDIDADPLRIESVDLTGSHGGVVISADGTSLTYTPEDDFVGTDTFQYTVTDGHGETATATVTVTVEKASTPDLVVTSLAAPTDTLVGDPAQAILTWIVKNQSLAAGTVSRWTDRVYFSSNDILGDADDVALADLDHEGLLDPDASYTATTTVTLPANLDGQFHLYVRTDVLNQVAELRGEDNNTSALTPIDVMLPPSPDLQVSEVTTPADGQPGQSITVQWSVRNAGSGNATGPWIDDVYLSPDGTRNGAILLASVKRATDLLSGEQYSSSAEVTLPEVADGTYTILVQTDAANAVFERDGEGNNERAPNGLSIGHADLSAVIVAAPADAVPGTTIAFEWSVTNTGTADALGSWVDRIYLSDDKALDDGDRLLGELQHIGPLAKNDGYAGLLDVLLPVEISGPRFFLLRTDATDAVKERSGESDNLVAAPVLIALAQYTDLAVSDVAGPTLAIGDDAPFTVSWTVTNLGTGAGSNDTWADSILASPDGVAGNADDVLLAQFAHTGLLQVKEGYARSETLLLPPGFQGRFHLFVRTDAGGAVFENGSETNNVADAGQTFDAMPIPYADLTVISVSAPPTGDSGRLLRVSWSVQNQGIGATNKSDWIDRVSLARNPDGGNVIATLADFTHTGTLGPGGGYTRTADVTLPDGISGTFFIVVQTSINGPFEFLYTSNNSAVSGAVEVTRSPAPDLVTSDVAAPEQVFDGSSIEVRYQVTNLGSGETDRDGWTDTVWLARDRKRPTPQRLTADGVPFVTGDILLGSFGHGGSLAVGQSYANTVSVRIPNQINGEFFITVWSDAYDTVTEDTIAANINPDDPNEIDSNNYKARPITVVLTPPPDLVVTAVSAQSQAVGGQPFTVRWTVRNDGNNQTFDDSWTDRVYLSDSQDVNAPNAVKWVLGDVTHTGQLGVGESYDAEATFVLSPAAAGKFVAVETNTTAIGQATFEGPFTGNNILAAAMNVTPAPADLVVTSVLTPAQNSSGDKATISWNVRNDGGPIWEGTRFWTDRVFISPDPTLLPGRATRLGDFVVALPRRLGTGETYTLTRDLTLPRGIDGTFYIHVQSNVEGTAGSAGFPSNDSSRSFFETHVFEDESNDLGSAAISVTYREPNLVVRAVTVPPTAVSSPTRDVSWTVTNVGTRATRESFWIDRLYLSLDGSLDSTDQMLGEFRHEGPTLARGDSYTASLQVGLPEGIAGNFFVLVFTDSNVIGALPPRDAGVSLEARFVVDPVMARIGEFRDEGDNIRATPLAVFRTDPVDLRVTTVSTPERATAGQSFDLSYTVTNSGATTSARQPSWDDFIYLSRDQFLDLQADVFLGSEQHLGVLGSGAMYENTRNLKLPRGLTGTFFVFVVTDPVRFALKPRGAVFEGPFEMNNATAGAIPLLIELPPPSDLQADAITIPASARPGEPLTVTWAVGNHGTFAAEGTWSDSAYLSEDSIWDIGDTPLGRVAHRGTLAPGERYTATLQTNLPPITSGTYRIIVRPDIFNEIFEGPDEANNHTASPTTLAVTVDELPLDTLLHTTLDAGQERLYQIRAGQGQTLRVDLTTSAEDAADQLFIRRGQLPSDTLFDAASGGTLQANQSVTVSTQDDIYYILVRGQSEPAANTPITLGARLLPFGITDIVTDRGGDGRYVTTTIIGAQFDPQAIIKLVRPGFAELGPVRTEVLDSTRIRAIFDFRDAPHGLYDLKVVNPGGAEAIVPYRYLVERALEPEVTIELGGPRVLAPGQVGTYGVALQGLTNIDTPYVFFQFGLPELGTNPDLFSLKYVAFTSDLRGQPDDTRLQNVPWASLDSAVNTTGEILAPGYALDLATRGFGSLTFNAHTYPGLNEILDRARAAFQAKIDQFYAQYRGLAIEQISDQLAALFNISRERANPLVNIDPADIAFKFHITASATALTRAEFVAQQQAEALRLRDAILADTTASQALTVIAADPASWTNLHLAALEEAGLLRPDDDAPPVRQSPKVISLIATLASGILAGPAGDAIITNGNLVGFFEQVRRWYGTKDGFGGSAAPPARVTMDLGLSHPTHFEAFNIFVPFGDARLDEPGLVRVAPPDFAGLFAAPGAADSLASLVGPFGFGNSQFLPATQPLPYTVRFQNASKASAAVSEVRVVMQLDPDLDPRSFRLGDLRLGDITIHVPDARGSFQGDFDFTRSKGFILRVSAGIDVFSSTAAWLLQAIDPTTGELLDDATCGLLPPNNAQGAGSGFVSYTVEPKAGLATGTQITANARVLFNTMPPRDTEKLTQTLDTVAPTTTLTAAPLVAVGSDFLVSWTSVDDAGGSGVKHVTVYVAADGGDFAIWLRQTTETSAVYQGKAGHRYEFLALATDNAGNQEKPLSGVPVPDDDSRVNVGALPSDDTITQDFGPPASPSAAPSVNPLFVKAQQGLPVAMPTSRATEFSSVLRPFTGQAFATGIPQSHAKIGPMAIVILPDRTVLASGGPTRGQLFHFSVEGGEGSAPLASVPFPIFDMGLDAAGNLWATTGGGPLLQLDPKTGAILGEFGDGLTQSLAVDPVNGRVYVSSGNGIEIFDPDTRRFSHYSDVRVGSLAFAPDGSLWAAVWPKRGDVIRFDVAKPQAANHPEVMLHFDDAVDSLAFGQPGTSLEGLLFISHNDGPTPGAGSEFTMVDLATLRHVALATGGTRGNIVKTSDDGRVFLSQSHQIDVFRPVVAPRVVAVNPPPDARIALPLGSIAVTFDHDMFVGQATDPRSVLNASDYRLVDESGNETAVQTVAYDQTSRTAVIGFDALNAGRYVFQIVRGVRSAEGLPLAEAFSTQFEVISNLSVVLSLQFSHARSDRANQTVSYDVAVTNISGTPVILPLVLELDPRQQFDGVPQNAAGQTADGKWLIDLSDSLPADGILRAGQSTSGRTITVRATGGQRVDFSPSVTGQPTANTPPRFVSQPVVQATTGQPFTYRAVAGDTDGDAVSYLLLVPPDGMTMDATTGLIHWTPTAESPGRASVVLQAYDARGGHATQQFTVQVEGVNQEPVWSALQPLVRGREGEPMVLPFLASDRDGDPLTYWVDNLPPGADFDPNLRLLTWTPDFSSAGTYENVRFTVSDGLHEISQLTTFLIAPGNQPPMLNRPADRSVREGEALRIQLMASDLEGMPLTFTSNLLPGGATLDAKTGLFEWTPTYIQHGVYTIPFLVGDGESQTVQTTTITVLNVNAAPEFDGLDVFQVQEGQKLRFRAFAFDADNPSFVPQDRLGNGSLTDLESTPSTVNYSASNLPSGATFEPATGFFDWPPQFTDAGEYFVTFTATDDGDGTGVALTATRTVPLRVLNTNRTPEIALLSNQQVKRGDVLEVPVQATDADGDPLTLSSAALPRFSTFIDNGDGTGVLRFAPGKGDRDFYTITVLAADNGDGGGAAAVLTATQSFVLTVPVPNEAPQLLPIGTKVAVFGQALAFTINTSDFDRDALSFTAEGLPPGAILTSGPAYGKATFTWTPTAADTGTYAITFQVTDSGNGDPAIAETDRQTITVVARASNAAPILTSIGDRTIREGETLVLQFAATDADGDSLLYTASNLPLGATFDPVQGILRWTPNLFQAGGYPGIVLSVTDGNRASTETITLQVNNANQAPVLLALSLQSGREGAPLHFTLIAADFDGDALAIFPLSPLPAGARFDAATRQFRWTPTFDQAGTYMLRFGAQDTGGLRGTVDIAVRIDNVNRAPMLGVSNHAAVIGQPVSFFVVGSDPDSQDRLTFSAANLPEGATLDPVTGRFQWTPGPGQSGEYTVTFSVSDGRSTVSRSAVVRADITPVRPEVTLELTPSSAVVPGQRVLVHVQASSFAGVKSLTLALDGQPVSLDGQGRATFVAPETGRHILEASVTDADGLEGKASNTLRVRDPRDESAPVVSFAAGLDSAVLTTATDIRATVADSNLDYWVLERAPLGFNTFTILAIGSTPVADRALATLDPTMLANGVYLLRLTAVDLSGRIAQAETVVQVNGAVKPTQYQRSETDFSAVLGGLTVDLVRSYDSLWADQSSSFGFGWRLANRDVLLQTDVPPTGRESSGLFNPFRVGTRVYLTLPDGRRVGFTFAPEKHEQGGVTYYTPAFVTDPGVDYALRSADALLTLANDRFFDLRTARAYHPASGLLQGPEYTLAAPDGTIYHLSTARGVEKQIAPNGTRLVYSDGGIAAIGTGETVRFVRDAAGRLTSIIAPDGRQVRYGYDAVGDLVKVSRSFSGDVTHYEYTADNGGLRRDASALSSDKQANQSSAFENDSRADISGFVPPPAGWTVRGTGAVSDNVLLLGEDRRFITSLSRTFAVPEGINSLHFTIDSARFGDNGRLEPPDAFELALLDADTMIPLLGTAAGLSDTDALLNIQQTGEVFFGSRVHVSGLTASGQTVSFSGPLNVTIDLSGIAAGRRVMMFFDLLGFGAADSSLLLTLASADSGGGDGDNGGGSGTGGAGGGNGGTGNTGAGDRTGGGDSGGAAGPSGSASGSSVFASTVGTILSRAFQPLVLTTDSNAAESALRSRKGSVEEPVTGAGVKSADPLRGLGGAEEEEEEEPFWPWQQNMRFPSENEETGPSGGDAALPGTPEPEMPEEMGNSILESLCEEAPCRPALEYDIDAYFSHGQSAADQDRDAGPIQELSGEMPTAVGKTCEDCGSRGPAPALVAAFFLAAAQRGEDKKRWDNDPQRQEKLA